MAAISARKTVQGVCAEHEQMPELSVVVPLYNEQEIIDELYRRLTTALGEADLDYELVFVNDGSRDATHSLLGAIQSKDTRVCVLHLSRNFGHQPAVCAGIDYARGQAVAVMDGDLQDPPEIIPEFVQLWRAGNDVVYAIRRHRKEGFLKRLGYGTFYRVLSLISDLEIPLDSGDFGLMDRRVVDSLKKLPERMRFVRGLRTFVGFRQVGLAYERSAREAGHPKYKLRHLIGLAVDGLVSFSSFPLRIVTYIGLTVAGVALLLALWVLADAVVQQSAPRGWASLAVIILFMSSAQIICTGMIGEYVRLIFLETKGRPTYIVADQRPARGEEARDYDRIECSGIGPMPEQHATIRPSR
jgi:dolichol-phosphate mannosyltransferase